MQGRALTFSFMLIVRRVAQAASARRGARAPPLGLPYALPRRPGPRLPWLQLRPKLDGMQRGPSAVSPPSARSSPSEKYHTVTACRGAADGSTYDA